MIPNTAILPDGEIIRSKKKHEVYLSADETQLIRNMADALPNKEDKTFLYHLAEKEYITKDEKGRMNRIFAEAASGFRDDSYFYA